MYSWEKNLPSEEKQNSRLNLFKLGLFTHKVHMYNITLSTMINLKNELTVGAIH